MTRRIIAGIVLALLSCLAVGEALGEGERGLRFGVLVGLVGQIPIGDDVGQPNASGDEFAPAMAIQVEILTFDIERYVQVVPYFRRTVVGGIDEDTYDAAFPDSAEITGSSLTQLGIGARWFFVQLERLRPFAALYLAYATTSVTYELDISGQLPPELQGMLGGLSESWRHSGMALTLGAGLRWDFDVGFFGQEWLLPLVVEAQWTQSFWLDAERNGELGVDESLLAAEGMSLDFVSVLVELGLLY